MADRVEEFVKWVKDDRKEEKIHPEVTKLDEEDKVSKDQHQWHEPYHAPYEGHRDTCGYHRRRPYETYYPHYGNNYHGGY